MKADVVKTVIEPHHGLPEFWRAEFWVDGRLVWQTSYESSRGEAERRLAARIRDWKAGYRW